MKVSNVNNVVLTSAGQNIIENKKSDLVEPQHGGGVYVPPKENDTVTISESGAQKLKDDLATPMHGGGVYVPPKIDK